MTRNTTHDENEGELRRNGRRFFTVLLALVGLAVALLAAPAAQAETVTIGELAPPTLIESCGECNVMQLQSAPGSPGYEVPPGQWTLTSWSGQGGGKGGSVRLDVFRPGPLAGQFLILAQSDFETVPKATVSTYPVHIPVEGGDLLGITTGPSGYPSVMTSGNLADVDTGIKGFPGAGKLTGPGTPYASKNFNGRRINIAATLERPDPPAAPNSPEGPSSAEAPSLVDTLSLLAEGHGTVASTDGDLHCPDVCAIAYPLGTAKTVVATPGPRAEFAGWTGACAGTVSTCAVTVTKALQVNARFLPSHAFTLGEVKRQRGRATQKAKVENPGKLRVTGKGVVAATVIARHAGVAKLPLAARAGTLRSLEASGSARTLVRVTFTPDGGRPKRLAEKVLLRG